MERTLEHELIVKEGDNLLTPLGMTSAESYRAVKAGQSALRRYEGLWGVPEPFVASLLDRKAIDQALDAHYSIRALETYSFFEKMAILSISRALEQSSVDPASDRVRFFLSTTKGNVARLETENRYRPDVLPGYSAQRICDFFHNPNPPIVISNACTSGLCAQIAAMRALQQGRCDHAIVVGADQQSKFIVSGFQSFKALSPLPCQPFDRDRQGLNLGEAAATLLYTRRPVDEIGPTDWIACRGAIRNDANHISGPSRTGEGCYRTLRAVLQDTPPEKLAFLNAHGTATPYNDEMEAIAIDRAGLSDVPVNGLKGYFGHTMGAAGLLETVLSMYALDDQTILGTRGYVHCGVSHPLRLSATHATTQRKSFIKLLSGFGGCNAALLFRQGGDLC